VSAPEAERSETSPLGRLALSRSTVDRATRLRGDTAWVAAAWADPRTRVLVVHDSSALVRADGNQPELVFVSPGEAPDGTRFLLGVDEGDVVYFGVSGELGGGTMIVEVTDGSTAVMEPAAAARPYFRFLDGFHPGGGNPLPGGDPGFTFSSCPRGQQGPNGQVTDFYLGFAIQAGRLAPVDVRTAASSRPIRLIFMSPDSKGAG